MIRKYRAAALTVAILAAVLAASSPAAASPVAGQWRQYGWEQGVYNWYDDYEPYWSTDSDGSFGAGCYYQPPYVFVVGLAAPTEAPTGPTPAEYSTDGGLTWEDFPTARSWPSAHYRFTPTPVAYEGETDPRLNFENKPVPYRRALSESDSHPYFRGEFGLSSAIYVPDSDGHHFSVQEKVRGECDGPHAGQFRLRSYEAGEFSADGGLTWVSAIERYTEGERSVDNGDGPEAGLHRYRYTRDSSDPQARLVTYNFQDQCPTDNDNPGPYLGTLAVPATCFVDVDGNNVHAANIQYMLRARITQGCGDGRFCPSRTITRAQMAAFLHRASSVFEEVSEPPALSDVPADAWYRTFALWAVKHDVIRAPGGRFDPGGAVTRADMAEMLAALPRFQYRITVPDRAQGLFDDTTGLPDATVRAIEGIRAAGVTAGCATGPLRYCPDKPVTRAQMASFLARVMWPDAQ